MIWQFSKQISKLFFQMSTRVYYSLLAKLKWGGKPFLEGESTDLSSKLSLTCEMGVMLTISKVFTILFLLSLWEEGIPWPFPKQISKLFFQMSVQVYSLLGQIEGERTAFLEGARRGMGCSVRLPPKALGC